MQLVTILIMPNVRITRQPWFLPCCIVILVIAIIVSGCSWAIWSFHHMTDLSNKTPDQAFRFIFKMSVPDEVYDVKVAGNASLSGNMWMHFKTHDLRKTIDAFKRNHQLSITGPSNQLIGIWDLKDVINSKYATEANWNEAIVIKKPQYYKYITLPDGTGWWGIFIVDREHHTVYAWGGLL